MPVPHATQVAQAQAALEQTLCDEALQAARAPLTHSALDDTPEPATAGSIEWLPPIVSEPWGFRTKAKMAVSGTAAAPVFTFPGGAAGVDLAECPLYPPLVTQVLHSAREVIRRAQIPPYNVGTRRGEIKYVLVTASDTEALVRFVLRSEDALDRLREHLDKLDPRATSVSANIQPVHAAVLEGEKDIHLAGADRLQLAVGPVTLGVLPRSFTQTNTAVAARLYTQVAQWLLEARPARVWDLFCGVGGFALTLAHAARERGHALQVRGVEITEDSVASANDSARALGLSEEQARFEAGNVVAWASAIPAAEKPQAAIVNPPRRGMGPTFSEWLNTSHIPVIVYSSCNPVTLAADLAWMPNYRVAKGRLVDMFPHTAHNEAVVLLERKDAL